jgi:hypothetical protein
MPIFPDPKREQSPGMAVTFGRGRSPPFHDVPGCATTAQNGEAVQKRETRERR